MQQQQFFSVLTGLTGLGAFWIILLIATRKHPWVLAIGEDGRPSTSKLQMLIWTAAVIFAFLAVFQIRFSAGFTDRLPDVPANLLIAMGISFTTAIAAKSIAVNSANNGDGSDSGSNSSSASAPPAAGVPTSGAAQNKSGIFCGDDGSPDLGKVQLMLWTIIAVGVFLSEVFALISHPTCSSAGGSPCSLSLENLQLPDIGQTLMILMGLGHGAYIGKKIAES
jgi:hypothetical protein